MWGDRKYLDEKFDSLSEQVANVEEKIDEHVSWHNSVYVKITNVSLKVVGYTFLGVCLLVCVIGLKEGSLMGIIKGFMG